MAKPPVLILLPGMQLYGQEKALITLASVLRDNGWPCHFLIHAGWGQAIAQRLEELEFPYTGLPMGTIFSLRLALKKPMIFWRNLSGIWRCSLALRKIIQKTGAKQLITGNATFSFYMLPALLRSDIRVIYRHGDEAAGHSFVHRFLNRLLFRRVDQHVANCQFLRERLRAVYPKIDPPIIYNVALTDIAKNKAFKNQAKRISTDDSLAMLFIGQLSPHKGIYLLLEAFQRLAQRYPSMVLHFAGYIPGMGHARDDRVMTALNQCMALYRERIIYHGRVNEPGPLFEMADIHVCPSIYQEPSANVILEAKAYGVPSVVFKVGGLTELVNHQKDGFICREVSAAGLAEGLEHFLSNPAARDAAGAAARESLHTRFGLERFTQQWLAVLAMPEASPE